MNTANTPSPKKSEFYWALLTSIPFPLVFFIRDYVNLNKSMANEHYNSPSKQAVLDLLPTVFVMLPFFIIYFIAGFVFMRFKKSSMFGKGLLTSAFIILLLSIAIVLVVHYWG